MKETIRKWAGQMRYALLGGALLVAGSGVAFSRLEDDGKAKAPEVRLEVDSTPINREGQWTGSFAPVVKKVAPSVVKVFTTSKVKQSEFRGYPWDDPLFRRFFGDDFFGKDPGRDSGRRMPMPRRHGLGSGVIVTEDGYILTNNHVVEGADEIKVAVMPDGKEYAAKVVGRDPKTDIAVLKINADSLSYAQLGDSDQIEVGDLVLAVGNPFGIGQTVTMGIVSATGRGNVGLDYEDFIQTDAAINPGNSGGALVDVHGRLIGINTAILSRTGGNHGIGFAVPINLARSVMESLIENGRVIRGYLGVLIQDVTPALAEEFGLKAPDGALIAEVTPDSPAEKAGLEVGDVIVEFNGERVRDSRHLKLKVGQTAPGKRVPVKLLRDGKTKELAVTLKELKDSETLAQAGRPALDPDEALKGVGVSDLNAEIRSRFGIPDDVKGAVVTWVEPGSAAYEAGLREGDVILEMNRKRVRSAEDAVELSRKLAGDKSILLRVWSKGGSRYMVVDESKEQVG